MQRINFLSLFVILLTSTVAPTKAMNLLWPYSVLVRPNCDGDSETNPFQFFTMVEGGVGAAKAYNAEGSASTLTIWECQQNALTMLEGFPALSQKSQLLTQLNAPDDGTRGRFNTCADLKLDFAGNVNFRYFFYKTCSLNFYLPFYVMELQNVNWQDQTLHINDADERVHTFLTDDFFAHVKELGNGLELGNWQRHGLGDFTAMLEWYNDFPQAKDFLKNVRLDVRAGLSFPTGLKRDIDKVFAIPFGFDGAFSLPFAGGLELTFAHNVWAGLDVFLIHIFGRTRVERIKTALDQTSLLYLQKAETYRDFGLAQEFSLFVGTKNLPEGLCTRIGYQYDKRGDDDICVLSNCYSTEIANTAPSLKAWTSHQIILRADYDFGVLLPEDSPSPRLSLYARLPFNGKRSVLVDTIGFSLAVDF